MGGVLQGVVRQVAADGTVTVQVGEIGPMGPGGRRLLRVDRSASVSYKDLTLVAPVKWDNVTVRFLRRRGAGGEGCAVAVRPTGRLIERS